jgi:hypothetical protein
MSMGAINRLTAPLSLNNRKTGEEVDREFEKKEKK